MLPNARGGAGQGALLTGIGRWRVVAAAITGVAIATLAVGPAALLLSVAVGGGAALWGAHCRRRLGGMTGDTLGAASEAGEVLVLLVGAALR